jgi:transposase
VIPVNPRITALEARMMGRRNEQWSLFYQFRLDERVPQDHLLRRIDRFVAAALADIHERLEPYYSEIGRPSVDPELMLRMLIIGYCYGLRSERRLTQELELHLAYRWFCRLDLDDKVPHHSTFSENRLHRFRESDVFRHIFERVVAACMTAGLIKAEGFAVDASVMEANASRYHGKAPDEIIWAEPERQTRAVKEYLAALKAEVEPNPDRKPPKVISPSDPSAAWTAKANKRVQFGYGLNYLIDLQNAVIVDVEPTPARTYDEVESTKTMLVRTERRFHLKPKRLAADTAYGTGRFLGWLVGRKIAPTSRFVTPATATTAPSLAVTFAGINAKASIPARTIRRCTLQALSTTATHSAIGLPSLTAMPAHSKCSVALTPRPGKFLVTSTRMRATWLAD